MEDTSIKKLWIEDGCISCNQCEDTCPEIFFVEIGGSSTVARNWQSQIATNPALRESAERAARDCPVEVIQVETDRSDG